MLLFKRTDLDAWVESHRVDPAPRNDRASTIQPPAASRPTRTTACAGGQRGVAGSSPCYEGAPERERPLPPPLCGDDTQKNNWAEQLEISRADLDEMSPGDFKRAWEARNARLRAGGVFDHLDELWKRLGQARIDAMTPSELIEAVSELREEAARQEPLHRDAAESGAPASGQPSA
jgi:hypothetical protein